MGTLTPEMYEEIKARSKKEFANCRSRNAAWLTYKKDKFYGANSSVCYGSMAYIDEGVSHICIAVTGGAYKVLTDEQVKKYLDILINHTHFSQLVLTRDIDKVMEDEFFCVDPDFPSNYIMSFLIASRMYRERPQCAEKVIALVEAGVKPELAVFIGNMCTEVNGNISFNVSSNDHDAVSSYWSVDCVKNFISGAYNKNGKHFSERTVWSGVINQYISKTPSINALTALKGCLVSKAGTSYVHPFPLLSLRLATAKEVSLPRKEFLERMAKAQYELGFVE